MYHNIFEQDVDMINDSMKSDKLIEMIQPKLLNKRKSRSAKLYSVGCMGKIVNLKLTMKDI